MAAALALFLHRLGEPPKPLRHGMPPGASARCVAKGLIVEAINGAVSAKLAWHEGLPSVLSIMTLLMLFCDLVAASSAGRQAPGAAGGRVRRRLQPAHGLTARRT